MNSLGRSLVVAFAPAAWVFMAGLFSITPFLLKAIMWSLGVGLVSYFGLNLVFDQAAVLVESYFADIPAGFSEWIALGRLDQAASLLLSALAFRTTLNVICGGTSRQLKLGFPRDC